MGDVIIFLSSIFIKEKKIKLLKLSNSILVQKSKINSKATENISEGSIVTYSNSQNLMPSRLFQ